MAQQPNPLDTDVFFYKDADTFFRDNATVGLTFDDITLATRYSEVLPRLTRVDTRLSKNLGLNIPMISADMDTVTEAEMAAAMARNGGLGIIHYNMTEKRQIREVARVKNDVHGLIQDPIAVSPESYIADVLEMIEVRNFKFHTFPVVDIANKFLGLLRGRVVKNRYRNVRVIDAMTPLEQVYTIQESEIADDPIGAADRFFNEHMGIHKLIVLSIHTTFFDPDRPSKISPIAISLCRFPRYQRRHHLYCSDYEAHYSSGVTVLPVAYLVLCVHFT